MSVGLCTCAAALVFVGLGLPAADAGPTKALSTWRGDYDTGNFSQWSEIQASRTNSHYSVSSVGDSAGTVVTSPVREGGHAAEFITYPNRGASDTDRAEVYVGVNTTQGTEGKDRYYAWSTMFPSAGNKNGFWPRAGDFNVFTQWHNATNPCGNNIQLGIDARSGRGGNKIYTDLSSRNPRNCDDSTRNAHVTLGRLRFDVWYDFVARIKWSDNASVGFYELWMNGTQVVRKMFGQTMADSQGVYWKQGFYRSAFPHTNTVYQDAAIRGQSLRSVMGTYKLSFVGRPRLDSPTDLSISAKTFAQARVRILVIGPGGAIVARGVRRADGNGRLVVGVPLAPAIHGPLRVVLKALVSSRLPASTREAAVNVTL